MPTRSQIITIQTAKRWLEKHRGFTDAAYRTVLRSVAGVASSTELGNDTFEQVMAVLEAHGFDQHPGGPTYWRDKAEREGGRVGWKIEAMCAEYGIASGGFVLRMTNGRTDRVGQLDGREAWVIIEALKKMCDREKPDALHVSGGSDDGDAPARDAVRSGSKARCRPQVRQMRGLFGDGDGAGDRPRRPQVRRAATSAAVEPVTPAPLPPQEERDDIPF